MIGPVYLDTNAVIEFVERRHDGLGFLFAAADRREVKLVTSELTLAEVLVRPLRQREDWLLQLYEGLLIEDRIIAMIPINLSILRGSAELRARSGGKTPDSLHVATAILSKCACLVSSDKRLRTPDALPRIAPDEIDRDFMRNWE